RHQYGMAEIVVQHVGADPQPFRRLGGSYQSRHRRDTFVEVIGKAQRVVAERLNLPRLLGKIGPRCYMPNADAEPERLHGASAFQKSMIRGGVGASIRQASP